MLLDELADAGFRAQAGSGGVPPVTCESEIPFAKTDFDFFYLPMDHSRLTQDPATTFALWPRLVRSRA